MKKLILLLIFSHLMFSCILFKESDLDPDSELGKLLTLYKILEFNRAYEWKWEYYFNDTSNPGNAILHRVTKIGNEENLPVPFTENQEGTHIGTFINNSDLNTTIYFPELGRYRIDSYLISQTLLASTIIDLKYPNQTIMEIVETTTTPPIIYENLSVQRITKRTHEPYLIYDDEASIGYFKGRHYFSYLLGFNRDFYLSTSVLSRKVYPILTSTEDGENWETIEFYDLITDVSNTNGNDVRLRKPFLAGDDIYVPVFTESGGMEDKKFLIKIPSSNRENFTILDITGRNNIGYNTLDQDTMFYFNNQFIYQELDTLATNSPAFYRDSNFLQSGSTNVALSSINPFNNVNFPIFFDSFVINSDQVNGYNNLNSTFTDSSSTFIHSAPLGGGGAKTILVGSKNRLFMLEFLSTSFRFSLSSNAPLFSANILNFFGDAYSKVTLDEVSLDGYSIDESKSYFNLTYNNNSEIAYLESDHSSGNFREFKVKSDFYNDTSYTEKRCLVSQQYDQPTMSIGNSLYICIKSPSRELIAPPNTEYEDFRKFVSTSKDGTNWTEWKEANLNPQILR